MRWREAKQQSERSCSWPAAGLVRPSPWKRPMPLAHMHNYSEVQQLTRKWNKLPRSYPNHSQWAHPTVSIRPPPACLSAGLLFFQRASDLRDPMAPGNTSPHLSRCPVLTCTQSVPAQSCGHLCHAEGAQACLTLPGLKPRSTSP